MLVTVPGMDQDALRERKLQDLVSVGVLAADVPRDVIDEVVAEHGRQARRSDGKLPRMSWSTWSWVWRYSAARCGTLVVNSCG